MSEKTQPKGAEEEYNGECHPKADDLHSISDLENVDKSPGEGVAVVDRAGNLIYANPAFAQFHGYSPADLLGSNMSILVKADEGGNILARLKSAETDKIITWDTEHLRRDGTGFPVSVSAVALPVGESQPEYFFLIIRERTDVDSRRHSIEQTRETVQRPGDYHDFFTHSLTGMYRSTLDGKLLEVNPHFAEIFGYESAEELTQRHASDLYDNRHARDDFINLLIRLGFVNNYQEVGKRRDGKRIRTLENARLVRDEAGNPRYIEGTLIDITDIFEAEERSRDYVRALEEAHGAILITTPEGNIQYANAAASDLYGYTAAHLVGMNIGDLVSDRDRTEIGEFLSHLSQKKRWVREITQINSRGEERLVNLAMSVLPDADGYPKVLVACAQDISDMRLLESQLRQAQKLEAIGLLASGLAHNINSPLSAIIMTTEMAQAKHPQVTEFDDILQAAARIGEIISNLMTKSRQEQSNEEMEIDVNQLVQTELKFLESNLFFKHNVDLEVDLAPDLPKIRGLYSDFSQCFHNLVQNALDAMSTASQTGLCVRTSWDQARNRITLSIRDTGCGIPTENIEKIFEPFFTTKSELGTEWDPYRPSGTGLGLSTVRQLLARYNATVDAESWQGEGSEFKIAIPVHNLEAVVDANKKADE